MAQSPGASDTRYLIALTTALAAMLAIVAAVTTGIDPFGVAGSPAHPGINARKPELFQRVRFAKAGAIARLAPEALILGSSRAEYGLDPQHPAITARGLQAYNAGIPAATVEEMAAFHEHAQATRALKLLIVGLDFFVFNAYSVPAADFDRGILRRVSGGLHGRWLPALELAVDRLSWNTLFWSGATVIQQMTERPDPFLESGLRNPAHKAAQNLREGGVAAAFNNAERGYLSSVWYPAPARRYALRREDGTVDTMRSFEALLDLAKRQGTEIHLYFSPVHARLQSALHLAGLRAVHDQWKRAVVSAAERRSIPVWDFAGFNPITTDPLPSEATSTTATRWYWESSHFRKEVGDLIITRLLGWPVAQDAAAFGVRLSDAVVEDHLAATLRDQVAYLVQNVREAAEVRESVARFAPPGRSPASPPPSPANGS